MTIGQAARHKRLQAGRAWPDIQIAEARRGFYGLFIEIKREGTRIRLKDGVTLVADPHIREQDAVIRSLFERGYYACFCVGFEDAKETIDKYLRG